MVNNEILSMNLAKIIAINAGNMITVTVFLDLPSTTFFDTISAESLSFYYRLQIFRL